MCCAHTAGGRHVSPDLYAGFTGISWQTATGHNCRSCERCQPLLGAAGASKRQLCYGVKGQRPFAVSTRRRSARNGSQPSCGRHRAFSRTQYLRPIRRRFAPCRTTSQRSWHKKQCRRHALDRFSVSHHRCVFLRRLRRAFSPSWRVSAPAIFPAQMGLVFALFWKRAKFEFCYTRTECGHPQ